MLVSKECWERGCSCYDDRVDKDPVEVVRRGWVGLTKEERLKISMENKPYVADIMEAHEKELKRRNT
jgi:hypothetical protein